MMNKNYALAAFFSLFMFSGCVSDQQVMVAQYDDETKNCEQLKYELNSLGAKFEDAKDDSGLTGKNVALGIFFWPGIIVNENQSKTDSPKTEINTTNITSHETFNYIFYTIVQRYLNEDYNRIRWNFLFETLER